MPKGDYDYINKLTEYFLNNKKKFWSDDPHDVKVRSWLQQHYPRFIQYAYDNTPEDIRKTIPTQKLGREFQKKRYLDRFGELRDEGSKYALVTIAKIAAPASGAGMLGPLASVTSWADVGAPLAQLAGTFGGAAIGNAYGRKLERDFNYYADAIKDHYGVDLSPRQFTDGALWQWEHPLGDALGFAGGWTGNAIGELGKNIFQYPINFVNNAVVRPKYRSWLKGFADITNPEFLEVAQNVADYNNNAMARYYAAQGIDPNGLSKLKFGLPGSGAPKNIVNSVSVGKGKDFYQSNKDGSFRYANNKDGDITYYAPGHKKDLFYKKYLNLEELKDFTKGSTAHELDHTAQKVYSLYRPDMNDPKEFARALHDVVYGSKKIDLARFDPEVNYDVASSRYIKFPNGIKIDMFPFVEKTNIAKGFIASGKQPSNYRYVWSASPNEVLSNHRFIQQKLGDFRPYNEMSIENKAAVRKFLSGQNALPEDYIDVFMTKLSSAGYANGGKIHIKPENRGKFTALKKRTGHSATWFKEHGTPAQKKMAVFALNARKWNHADGGLLKRYDLGGNTQDAILYDYFQSNDSPLADTLFIQPQSANTPAYAVKTSGDAPDPVYMPVVENPVVSQEPAFNPMEVTNRLKHAAAYAAATKIFQNTVPRDVVNTYIRTQENTAEPEYSPSEDLIQSLIGYEGFLERPSRKIDGKWTIGYGDTDKALNDYYLKNPNKKYNKAEAEKRLRDRVANEFLPELKKSVPNWDRLTPQQKDSLLSYAYNVGKYFTSTHKNFVSAMKDFDIVRAAKELNAGWNQRDKSTGKPLYGIRKRRIREQRAFLGDKFSVGGVIDKLKKTYSGDAKAMLEAVRKAKSETYEQM